MLAGEAGADALAGELARQRMLLLGARRLAEADVPEAAELDRAVRGDLAQARAWALLCESQTRRLTDALESAGIPALAVKGPGLARRLYGDAALRTSNDIDLLVDAENLSRALTALGSIGYSVAPSSAQPADGLPALHFTLDPAQPGQPPVDLHWRLHWYEAEFAAAALSRSVTAGGERLAQPADEIAALLLFYARDGFLGLRYATDIAAWWDLFGEALPPRGLAPIIEAHPKLERALTAAAVQSERLVGVPAGRLLGKPPRVRRGVGMAVRLSNWSGTGERDQRIADQVVVDLLLSPAGDRLEFLRRFVFPSQSGVVRYERQPEESRPPRAVWLPTHALKALARIALGLWGLRRGAQRSPVPDVPA